MELIASINGAINGVVWGPPMLILLVGCGILLTIRTAGVQFRKFGYAMKNTIGKIFKKTEAAEGDDEDITDFGAEDVFDFDDVPSLDDMDMDISFDDLDDK